MKPFRLRLGAVLLCFTAIILGLYSCLKEPASNEPIAQKTLLTDAQLIAKAKDAFTQSLAAESSTGKRAADVTATPPLPGMEKVLDWSKAYTATISVGKMVMLPVGYSGQVYAQVGGQKVPLNSLTRLFIYTDSLGGNHIEVVTRIPDEAYLSHGGSGNRFTGIITVQDWQGHFIKAFRFMADGAILNLGAPTYRTVSSTAGKAVQEYRRQDWTCYDMVYTGYNESMATGEISPWSYTQGQYCIGSGTSGGTSGGSQSPGGNTQFTRPSDYDGGGYQGTQDNQKVRTDSLKAKSPCAVKLIIDSLMKINAYNEFIEAFTNNQRPDLKWDSKDMPWNQQIDALNYKYQLGETNPDTTGIGLSATIYLNNKMLQNSSQLLITSTAIHETLHAYINYNFKIASSNVVNNYSNAGSWIYGLDSWYALNGLSSNYSNHSEILIHQFEKAINILALWDKHSHTTKQYAMAMLYGLDNPGTDLNSSINATIISRLEAFYNDILSKYGITESELKSYWKAELNAPTNNKLPSNGC